ncbi:MAG: 2-dehydropantoate 2-reductase [Bacillus sp. (in: firmicutes)]
MRIGIIGGGAIGLLFGAYLSKNHHVTIYTRSNEQSKEIMEKGLVLKKGTTQEICRVHAVPFPSDDVKRDDLVIVAVKQYHLPEIISYLQSLSCNLLFIQNGMGHLQYCEVLSASSEVFVGIVEHGALKEGQAELVHTGDGIVKIASYNGDIQRIQVLQNEAFPISFEDDYYEMLQKKLMVNAMINPLTAVLRVTNGELIHNTYYHQLFQRLFEELVPILQIENQNELYCHVESICRNTAKNRSSMLRDIEENRPTEIDSILGYILQKAEQKQMQAPLTNNLYLMVKGEECNEREV